MNKQVHKDDGEIVLQVVRESIDDTAPQNTAKNPAAVALGRLGGQKGGKARAKSLSAEDRKLIAHNAAVARWSKRNDS